MMDKREVRKMLRAAVSPCPEAESEAIFTKVESLPAFQSAGCVLLYWSMPSEVRTHEFIRKWAGRKRILLPRVSGETLEICEYSPVKMVEGYRGIMEPSPEAAVCNAGEAGFAIVPGLGFDRLCHRLGRGGGYYDRLIPLLRCPVAAVAYRHQIISEVPVQKWDAPVDMVVTSDEIFLPL